jgi:hypothetical protein
VNRNLIFPLGHKFPLFLNCLGLFTLQECFLLRPPTHRRHTQAGNQ